MDLSGIWIKTFSGQPPAIELCERCQHGWPRCCLHSSLCEVGVSASLSLLQDSALGLLVWERHVLEASSGYKFRMGNVLFQWEYPTFCLFSLTSESKASLEVNFHLLLSLLHLLYLCCPNPMASVITFVQGTLLSLALISFLGTW